MPGHQLALALRSAYLALHRASDALFAPWGVTADQFVVLAALMEDDASSQRGLAARASTDPSTLRAMLVLLEARGLVERRPHPGDGRARRVRVTAEGRRVFRRMWQASEPLRERMLASLQAGEARRLVDGLLRISREMAAAGAAGRAARSAPGL